MVRFKSIRELMQAVVDGRVPFNVVSPGPAAAELGITRQSLHKRLVRGTIRGWRAEGVILVDYAQVRAEVKRKKGIAETQGELLNESP